MSFIAFMSLIQARFGLAWCAVKEGHVLGASEDMTVCHWQVLAVSQIIPSLTAYTGTSTRIKKGRMQLNPWLYIRVTPLQWAYV